MNIQTAIKTLINRQDLSNEQMEKAMLEIMTGECTDAQIAGFLIALAMKGETVNEIVAATRVMRGLSKKITLNTKKTMVDTCGTGGDNLSTFNISTASALVIASSGVMVAKHGNRSISSQSGSADLLELAGVKIDCDLTTVQQCIEKINIGFMFAPAFHPAMKYAIGARKEMAVRTIFNILGPLTNPANAKRQVIGVFDKKLQRTMVEVLKKLGSEKVMSVCAEDGLDEISISVPTNIVELNNGIIKEYQIKPEDFGFKSENISKIQVKNSEESLEMIQKALDGEDSAAKNIIALNAGAALYVAGREKSLAEGVKKATEILNSGKAHQKLDDFVRESNGC
jgi:anthranilate phosphoribosyltransferase